MVRSYQVRRAAPSALLPWMAGSGQIGYNDLAQTYDPRGTFLISNRWDTGMGEVGALFSLAYTRRNVLEEGSSSGRWENPSVTKRLLSVHGVVFDVLGLARPEIRPNGLFRGDP